MNEINYYDNDKLVIFLENHFSEFGPDYEIKIDKILNKISDGKLKETSEIEELLKIEFKEENLDDIKRYIDYIYKSNFSKKIIPEEFEKEIADDIEKADKKYKEYENLQKERIELEKKLKELEQEEELERIERTKKLEKQETDKQEEDERKKEKDKKRIIDLEVSKKYMKRISQDESIRIINNNKTNNKYLENQYNRIIEIRKDIKSTKISIANLNSIEQKSKYENILIDLENEYENLINTSINYISESNKINIAIEKLKKPSESLTNEKKYVEERRDFFNKYSEYLFITSGVFFAFFILFFYINYIIEFEFLKEKKIEFTIYFLAVFPIVFSALIGLVMIRQSNMKSKELIDINKRFILIDEINNSLKALLEIYRDKDISAKTEKIIDRLIINILNYTNNNANDTNSEKELLEANTKFDDTIDSLNKKLTFITDTIKNLKGSN